MGQLKRGRSVGWVWIYDSDRTLAVGPSQVMIQRRTQSTETRRHILIPSHKRQRQNYNSFLHGALEPFPAHSR